MSVADSRRALRARNRNRAETLTPSHYRFPSPARGSRYLAFFSRTEHGVHDNYLAWFARTEHGVHGDYLAFFFRPPRIASARQTP